MFGSFVIAVGFPIPNREHQKGIELPLELMITLGRNWYPTDYRKTFFLKGYSTALILMSQTQSPSNGILNLKKIEQNPLTWKRSKRYAEWY